MRLARSSAVEHKRKPEATLFRVVAGIFKFGLVLGMPGTVVRSAFDSCGWAIEKVGRLVVYGKLTLCGPLAKRDVVFRFLKCDNVFHLHFPFLAANFFSI